MLTHYARAIRLSSSTLLALAALAACADTAAAPLAPPTDPPSVTTDPLATATVVLATTTLRTVPVKPSTSIADGVGINIHASYFNTAYDRDMAPYLTNLGIRRVRDGGLVFANDGWMRTVYGRLQALANKGFRFTFVMAPYANNGVYTNASHVSTVANWIPASTIDGFEGLNEPDLSRRSTWVADTRNFQKALYTAVRADSRLVNVPVLGPAVTSSGAATSLGDLTTWLTQGNMHSYPGGKSPVPSLVFNLTMVKPISGTRAVVATETGYHSDATVVTTHPAVSATAMARYVPRLALEYARAGVTRTFVYELFDTPGTSGNMLFGLVNADGRVKPAYNALANLNAILADASTGTMKSTFTYALAGDTTDVHQMVLGKRDGRVYLAVWQEKPSYDTVLNKDIVVPNRNLQLVFGAPTAVQLYRPRASRTAYLNAGTVTTLALSVPDEVIVVEMKQ